MDIPGIGIDNNFFTTLSFMYYNHMVSNWEYSVTVKILKGNTCDGALFW